MGETIERLASAWLHNERSVWIREPAHPATARHLTVFLDAELYRDRVGAVAVIEELQGRIADSWQVFVSMESEEARWRECPCHPPFAQFIAHELMPRLERRQPSLAFAERTLVGLSYTGLAAAYVAHEHPDLFQRVICQSGSFWWNDCWLPDRYAALTRPLPVAFYLDVGTNEIDENVRHREGVVQVVSQLEGVRRCRDALRRSGHAVTYAEFDGGHDGGSWRRALPAALQWAMPSTPSDGTPVPVSRRIVDPASKPKAEYHEWSPRYPEVARALVAALVPPPPGVSFEHVGSTAVPGCGGKGTIDLLALYPDGGLAATREFLLAAGFCGQGSEFARPWPADRPMLLGTFRWRGHPFLVYVHVVHERSEEVRRFREFRDRLRRDPRLVADYCAEKRRIIAAGVSDTDDYAVQKRPVIHRILGAAQALRDPRASEESVRDA